MYYHEHMNPDDFVRLLRAGGITFAGYKRRKIYGTLRCKSGKRMNMANRVFFTSEEEALHAGYRPCARCMSSEYRVWKEKQAS
jgi:methylphosphotriester-DNA--protein-cysteine methyltransferase